MSYITYFYFGLVTTLWLAIAINNMIAGFRNDTTKFADFDPDVFQVHYAVIAIFFGLTGEFS